MRWPKDVFIGPVSVAGVADVKTGQLSHQFASTVAAVTSARISDMAVVPYRQDQAPRLDFWGSDIRNHTTEGDTLWVNYTTSHFSSRSTVS